MSWQSILKFDEELDPLSVQAGQQQISDDLETHYDEHSSYLHEDYDDSLPSQKKALDMLADAANKSANALQFLDMIKNVEGYVNKDKIKQSLKMAVEEYDKLKEIDKEDYENGEHDFSLSKWSEISQEGTNIHKNIYRRIDRMIKEENMHKGFIGRVARHKAGN